MLDHPELATVLDELRRRTAEQVAMFFGPEHEPLSPARRADVVATIDSANSVIAGRMMVEVHDRSEAQIRRAWRSALAALLDSLD